MGLFSSKPEMPSDENALPGRAEVIPVPAHHFVNGNPMQGPFAETMEKAMFGLGCFWGAECIFWEQTGVHVTAAGYAGGLTPNPNYEEVCSAMTGHNEVVLVVFDRTTTNYQSLLEVFWESHDPTQGMRQGNDVGTQYRSGIYTYTDEQHTLALKSLEIFQAKLKASGFESITTEIIQAPEFYFANTIISNIWQKYPMATAVLVERVSATQVEFGLNSTF